MGFFLVGMLAIKAQGLTILGAPLLLPLAERKIGLISGRKQVRRLYIVARVGLALLFRIFCNFLFRLFFQVLELLTA